MSPRPDTALRDYGDALRRQRNVRRQLTKRAILIGSGCAVLLATIALPPAPRLLWNASASAPIGLYVVEPGIMAQVGDMVVARPPADAAKLAASRGYLPIGVPLVKRAAAGPGDQVCASGTSIMIDGQAVARRRSTDERGRRMPWWSGCRSLREGQYFLLMADVPASFDGRYFEITDGAEIIGPARLIWRR
ncbi:S26 family signal peptidase [Nostoc sp. 3335mG]|nr:S26 family signal peptidase [Nostoc sp. 3335mG]